MEMLTAYPVSKETVQVGACCAVPPRTIMQIIDKDGNVIAHAQADTGGWINLAVITQKALAPFALRLYAMSHPATRPTIIRRTTRPGLLDGWYFHRTRSQWSPAQTPIIG